MSQTLHEAWGFRNRKRTTVSPTCTSFCRVAAAAASCCRPSSSAWDRGETKGYY